MHGGHGVHGGHWEHGECCGHGGQWEHWGLGGQGPKDEHPKYCPAADLQTLNTLLQTSTNIAQVAFGICES